MHLLATNDTVMLPQNRVISSDHLDIAATFPACVPRFACANSFSEFIMETLCAHSR